MNRSGFTLIELILVMVLVVILAATVVPMIFKGGADLSVVAAAMKVKDDIRYAQTLAMQRHKLPTPAVTNPTYRYRMTFDAGTDIYTIVNDANNNGTWGEGLAENVRKPSTGDTSFIVQLNVGDYAGIDITAVGFDSGLLEFDLFGTPFDGAGRLTTAKSITLERSGQSATITVTPGTGRVVVQ